MGRVALVTYFTLFLTYLDYVITATWETFLTF
jgi:hypothetical protein